MELDLFHSNKCNLEKIFGAKYSKDYKCPKCGEDPQDVPYEVEDKEYPKCYNTTKGYNGFVDCHEWDELHCCEKCKTYFWFRTGI